MILLEINTDTKIAVVSAIVALLSLFFTFLISRTAKKSLKLAEKQYGDKLPDFETYFIQGFRFNVKNGKSLRKLLLFQLTLKNKAELKNTLKAELEIEYLRDDDSFSKIMIDHNPELESLISKKDFSFFPIDIELEAKTISTKWLIFEQPDYISKQHRIEKFVMKFRDLHDNIKLSETVLIKDIEG
jgi:hypothetical protein